MSGKGEENLKDLFERFYDADEAERCVGDVAAGEQMLREHPAPEPDDALIADIKAEVAEALRHRHAGLVRRTHWKIAVVAATVGLVVGLGVRFYVKGRGEPKTFVASILPTEIWESDDIAADDADLARLIAEIDSIEGEIMSLPPAKGVDASDEPAGEIEMELIEIDSDFWKG
jgi:hypothetical protein